MSLSGECGDKKPNNGVYFKSCMSQCLGIFGKNITYYFPL